MLALLLSIATLAVSQSFDPLVNGTLHDVVTVAGVEGVHIENSYSHPSSICIALSYSRKFI